MSKRKGVMSTCTYCEKPVDLTRSHARNMTTGEYCHLDCFIEHEPQGRAIVERAKQIAADEVESATTRRVLH